MKPRRPEEYGEGNPTRFDTGNDPHRVRVRAPAWVRDIWWGPLIAILTTVLVAWMAQGYVTMAIIEGGNDGVRIALVALWLLGLAIGHMLPTPSPLGIPQPRCAPARGNRETREDDA